MDQTFQLTLKKGNEQIFTNEVLGSKTIPT